MTDLLKKLGKTPITPKISKGLPESPGVYVFLKSEEPIYIGKAINLKRRVNSYFDLDLEPKTARMVKEATDLSFIKVTSELEALLLEARLIRTYMPHYNIAAKDDKHPLYIRITKDNYPRVITARKIAENEKNIAFFGPFPSSRNVKSVLVMLRKIFPYADHKTGSGKLGGRACLYSHIGLCNPCPNVIEKIKEEKTKKLLKKEYFRNIRRVKAVLEGRFSGIKKELYREMEKYSKLQNYEEAKFIRDKIERLDYITRPQMPTEFYIENPNLYEDQRRKEMKELRLILKSNGMALANVSRIECFDIAHLAGTNPTASMVTFINGEPEKTLYRHFRVKSAKGGDDYGSLKEIIKRRINHMGVHSPLSDWGTPDLIIVDGGRGQLDSFLSILNENALEIPVVGIAKNPDRLIFRENKVKLSGLVLNLIQRIRDEAHRFARRYHHELISTSLAHENTP